MKRNVTTLYTYKSHACSSLLLQNHIKNVLAHFNYPFHLNDWTTDVPYRIGCLSLESEDNIMWMHDTWITAERSVISNPSFCCLFLLIGGVRDTRDRWELHRKIWLENIKADHMEQLSADGNITLVSINQSKNTHICISKDNDHCAEITCISRCDLLSTQHRTNDSMEGHKDDFLNTVKNVKTETEGRRIQKQCWWNEMEEMKL
jgi:hypothetical protein